MIVVLEEAQTAQLGVGPTHRAGEVMGVHTLVEVRVLVSGIPTFIITRITATGTVAAQLPVTEAGFQVITRGDQIIVEGLGIKQTLSRVITILGMQ